MTKKFRWFRESDEPRLRELHAEGLDDYEIARAMGFGRITIYRRRRRLELPGCWSSEFDGMLFFAVTTHPIAR